MKPPHYFDLISEIAKEMDIDFECVHYTFEGIRAILRWRDDIPYEIIIRAINNKEDNDGQYG